MQSFIATLRAINITPFDGAIFTFIFAPISITQNLSNKKVAISYAFHKYTKIVCVLEVL